VRESIPSLTKESCGIKPHDVSLHVRRIHLVKNTHNVTPAPAAPQTLEPTPAGDAIDRRNFLSCMAWAGTGLLWTIAGGIPTSKLLAATAAPRAETHSTGGFSFVQISDSHIGFNKAAN
jgi:hypothetical protein